MIETTLRTTFVPGTNVRGEITGANWTFLLPSLEIDHALCFGAPPAAALTMLARIARRVTVIATGEAERSVRTWAAEHGTEHVSVVPPDGGGRRPRADLVWMIERGSVDFDALVAPGGTVYEERRGRGAPGELALHLTPFGGEMRTAVPLADSATIDWFARHGLRGRSLDVHGLKRLLGRRGQPGRAEGGAGAPAPGARTELGRGVGHAVIGAVSFAERLALRVAWVRARFGRQATLVLPEGEGPDPPRWLRDLATGFGIDLGGCRWGLAALGQYSSRKILFFLWSPGAPPGAPPRWVVKLTRDPSLNGRLENLVRALETLHRIPGLDAGAVPRAAFHGRHAGLAVVAEEVVEGGPFAERSAWTADCPVAASAVNWLTDLAAATVEAADPAEVAAALRRLFTDFAEIYDLGADERAFLSDQIGALGEVTTPFPLVFQHGDPGTWNLFANDAGRIAFLDWEAAEPEGIPLWDLFYFVRSFALGCEGRRGTRDRLAAVESGMFDDTPIGRLLVDAVHRYRERVNLDAAFVEPLFHTCWMHRALKESTRLTPERLGSAHYLAMMRLGIARRDAKTLRRMFER